MGSKTYLNRMGPARYMRKVKDEWRYYPQSIAVEDYYLIVKDGRKEDLEKAITNEVVLSLSIGPFVLGLAMLNRYSLMFSSIIIPYFMYRRYLYKRNYCIDCGFKKPSYFKNIFKIAYFSIDENDNKQYITVFICMIVMLFGVYFYIKSNIFLGAFICALLTSMLFVVFVLTTLKKIKKYSSSKVK